jgi:hypothetical protein
MSVRIVGPSVCNRAHRRRLPCGLGGRASPLVNIRDAALDVTRPRIDVVRLIEETLMQKLVISTCALAAVLAMPSRAQTPIVSRTDVPVHRVVLFSSGVGYFEHDGSVRGSGSTELRFKADQINDVLKSLVLQDRDGGRVTAVTYPSRAPLSKTLRSFQVDITSNPSLAELLNQLRGARVTVLASAEHMTGTILGVEQREKATGKDGETVTVPVLDLLNGATIRAVELASVTSLSLDDPQLEDELTKALSALAQARDQDKKPVSIAFDGAGERRVRIGYVVESPVWKTSYRLVLSDKHGQLQGWAIVENQTESDWNDVSLSLVSGRPISFTMDLYQPLYATRPNVVPEIFAGLRPQVYEDGIQSAADSVAMEPSNRLGAAGGRLDNSTIYKKAEANRLFTDRLRNAPMQLESVVVTANAKDEDLYASVRSRATTADLGQLFEYSVGDVTLPRQKSAMLPIITDTVGVERVSIYNASVLPRNPLSGVRVRNTTGKLLLQGPVTVLDKNMYAGDARIDDVPAGQERLLSYGVDLELVVDATKETDTSVIVAAKIVKGVLQVERKLVATREYRVENKGERDKELIIEHPIREGWKLVDTQKPIETTANLYRFQGKVAAGKVTTLVVKEELVQGQTIALMTIDPGSLIAYSKTGDLPKSVRSALEHAVELRNRIADLDRQVSEHVQQLTQITQEQTRIREDMKAVSQSTPYYARLLAKLNDQESVIERLQRERDDLIAQRDAQRKQFDDYLATLVVE